MVSFFDQVLLEANASHDRVTVQLLSLSENGQILATYGSEELCGPGRSFVYSFNGTVWERMGQRLPDIYQVTDIMLSANGKVVATISRDGGECSFGSDGIVNVWSWNESPHAWEPLGVHSSQSFFSACGEKPPYENYCCSLHMSLSGDGHILALGNADLRQVFVFTYDADQDQWFPLGQTLTDTGTSSSSTRRRKEIHYFGGGVSLSRDGTRLTLGAERLLCSFQYSNETNQWMTFSHD